LSLSELSLKKIDLAVDLFPKGSEVRVDLVELVEDGIHGGSIRLRDSGDRAYFSVLKS